MGLQHVIRGASEAEYEGADMSTANDGGPSGTPDGSVMARCLTGAPCTVGRAHVWAVTGQRANEPVGDA